MQINKYDAIIEESICAAKSNYLENETNVKIYLK